MDTETTKLIVSEIFGPTIQGEGPSVGVPAIFLRLGICNLSCTWCDSKYTWDWENYDPKEELSRLSVDDITEKLEGLVEHSNIPLLVITGGEPLLQQTKLWPIARRMRFLPHQFPGMRIEIETAGTIIPDRKLSKHVSFNISPKLGSSGNNIKKSLRPEVLRFFNREDIASCFKFVVTAENRIRDFAEIDELVKTCQITKPVYIMAEGTTKERILEGQKKILPEIISRGWRLSPRLHIDLFGDTRAT